MRVLYLDALFVLNLGVNYLLLLSTAKIGAVHILRRRILLGALFGAVYAVLAFLPQFGFLLPAPMRIVSGASMVLIAFGSKRGLLRIGLIFFAVSAAFGGAVFALSLFGGSPSPTGQLFLPINLRMLLITFAICYFVMKLVFSRLGRDVGGKLLQIEISRRGQTVTCTGLLDTGHSLTDPITGAPVLVVETEAILSLFSAEAAVLLKNAQSPVDLLRDLDKTPDEKSFYLIPYTSVGISHGFLLAFRPDSLRIDGRDSPSVSIALSPTRLSDGGRYSALIGGGLL